MRVLPGYFYRDKVNDLLSDVVLVLIVDMYDGRGALFCLLFSTIDFVNMI